jgi:hypothetical protein
VPGPYAITPSNAAANGAFVPSNYTITYVNGALTVTPAPVPPIVPPIVPPVAPPIAPPIVAPVVALAISTETPELSQLQTTENAAPLVEVAGMNLAVLGTGVRMPAVQVAEVPPAVQFAEVPAPVQAAPQLSGFTDTRIVDPPVMPPTIYVPPQRPRKPDRN